MTLPPRPRTFTCEKRREVENSSLPFPFPYLKGGEGKNQQLISLGKEGEEVLKKVLEEEGGADLTFFVSLTLPSLFFGGELGGGDLIRLDTPSFPPAFLMG